MIYPTAKMSEEVNMVCPVRNMTVQLSTPYTEHEHHSAQCHRQTDWQTTSSRQEPIVLHADNRLKSPQNVKVKHTAEW